MITSDLGVTRNIGLRDDFKKRSNWKQLERSIINHSHEMDVASLADEKHIYFKQKL